MPVGTQGAVKAIEHRELESAGAGLILSNTYHLYLRPGTDLIRKSGGLHKFASWQQSLLTDSGGYQVFSLADLRTLDDDGVVFRSHIDGSSHTFTPESVIDAQRAIGSDIMMPLDECVGFPSDEEKLAVGAERTVAWSDKSLDAFERTAPLYGFDQALFGIVQGGTSERLREKCAEALIQRPFSGYAIGGLAVGEPVQEMYRTVSVTNALLPEDRPRYLMGVGTPENLIRCIGLGIDMFDCVLPTRNARNGMLFTSKGNLNIRNAVHREDDGQIDDACSCYTCSTFGRSYLRHLFNAGEILGLQLATIHNVSFYLNLMRSARQAVLERRFNTWSEATLRELANSQTRSQ